MSLSGIKDVDLKILSELNDRDLFSFCLADKAVNKMCKDEHFWRNRFVSRFGQLKKTKNWRNSYLKVISSLEKYSKNPWEFFKEVSWNITEPAKNANIIPFRFLELGKEVTIYFPIDAYVHAGFTKRIYKSERTFTPEQILMIIYNFYREPITEKEYNEMLENDVEGIYEYSREDILNKKVMHIDLMHGYHFFEGFRDHVDGHILMLGV